MIGLKGLRPNSGDIQQIESKLVQKKGFLKKDESDENILDPHILKGYYLLSTLLLSIESAMHKEAEAQKEKKHEALESPS